MEGFDISKVSEIYIGSSPVSSIYLGSNKIWPSAHDYSKDYLTFTALEDTTFTFSKNSLQYSLDDGSTWTTLAANTNTPTITAGNKIIWKQTGLTPSSPGIGTFSAKGKFEASGNIMSLYYGDEFDGENDLTGKNYAFYRLFNNNTMLSNVKNLILPATTLADHCYSDMFASCSSLTTAPELPATTLTAFCYDSMFSSCSSLTTAPELPATTLTQQCYYYMFIGCSHLNYIKMLATNISASSCLTYWVYGVSSTGTFVKNAAMTTLPHGSHGIPNGWTLINA